MGQKLPHIPLSFTGNPHTVGKKSALRSRASITASTLSDFNRAWAIALVCLGCERETSCPNSLAFSTNHHHEPVASTAIFVPWGVFSKLRERSEDRLRNETVTAAAPLSEQPTALLVCVFLLRQSSPFDVLFLYG